MKTIHHRKPAPGKPTYLKVRFTVLDDPPRLQFEVLEQDEALRKFGNITEDVCSLHFPELSLDEIFLRGADKKPDRRIDEMEFSNAETRDRYLIWAQKALINAELRIIEICEGKK